MLKSPARFTEKLGHTRPTQPVAALRLAKGTTVRQRTSVLTPEETMHHPHRRHSFLVLSIALALALATPAFAQVGENTEVADFTVGGPVTSVDTAKHTITIGGSTGGTFEVDPNATLLKGDKKLKLGDIQVGWYVDGSGDLRGATNPKKVITYLEEVDQGGK